MFLNKEIMKISIQLYGGEQLDEVIQALSVLQPIRKGQVKIELSVSPLKSLQLPEVTKPHHRDYQVIRQADNTLRCRESGQTIPSTRRGGIDKVKLAQEILAGKWIPFGLQYPQSKHTVLP